MRETVKFETFPQLVLFTFALNALEKFGSYWKRQENDAWVRLGQVASKFVSSDNPEQNNLV